MSRSITLTLTTGFNVLLTFLVTRSQDQDLRSGRYTRGDGSQIGGHVQLQELVVVSVYRDCLCPQALWKTS